MITKDNTTRVMEFFFKYPETKFHLRKLERLTGLSMPGVRKITLYEIVIKKTEPEFINTLANGIILYGYILTVCQNSLRSLIQNF